MFFHTKTTNRDDEWWPRKLWYSRKQPIETSSSWYENVDIYENNQLNHRVSHENAGINEKKKKQ